MPELSDHIHQITPYEGPLLTPQEKAALGLDNTKHYYKNSRCTFEGCTYFTHAEIPVFKIRGPRISRKK